MSWGFAIMSRADFQPAKAVSEKALPIREISRLTGVNSITLRAWERRYGLIKPLRTHKGHRLYSHEDVELVKKIQMWLARGLAIGKVSELLAAGQLGQDTGVENTWQTYVTELLTIMAHLNSGKLDSFFQQLFSVYPATLMADQLITPVLHKLGQDVFGNSVKKAVLVNRLSEYLLALIQHQHQQVKGPRIGIIQLGNPTEPLLNVLLHYALTMNQKQSHLLGVISAAEVILAIEQLQLESVIIYNHACTRLGDFRNDIFQLIQQTSVPVVIGGSLALALKLPVTNNLHVLGGAGQQDILNCLDCIFPAASL